MLLSVERPFVGVLSEQSPRVTWSERSSLDFRRCSFRGIPDWLGGIRAAKRRVISLQACFSNYRRAVRDSGKLILVNSREQYLHELCDVDAVGVCQAVTPAWLFPERLFQ